ncbi:MULTISPECIES: SapC family protein [Thiorhodovibrio]|uniref:SapC family protein n=1 Tax=Thiorhodovibrio TaxID=61593 RepID=UPI0019125ADA|nr:MULTISPECIES: SapC family protein [Thiorhodovibrio]MBK5969030.1 hypothetical protein [Thiorhodovibrio winogradskyi]WPL15089.1 SapC [Thiorhodovibrio litoralis]
MNQVALTKARHGHLRRRLGPLFFLAEQPLAPLAVAEAARAAVDLPLALSRDAQGTLRLVAILGRRAGENVHVGPKGGWLGGYVPTVVRCHPFSLQMNGAEAVVVVDETSDWLSASEGEPLFTPEGAFAPELERLVQLMKTRLPLPVRDRPVLDALDASGVLEPWPELGEGLLRVSAQRLDGLTDQAFLRLREQGGLALAYAQLISAPCLRRMENLTKLGTRLGEQQGRAREREPFVLEDPNAGMLVFDD